MDMELPSWLKSHSESEKNLVDSSVQKSANTMKGASEAARLFGVNVSLIKKWGTEFADFLSVSANPSKGKTRWYSESDIKVFALVSCYWKDDLDYEYIHSLLNQGCHHDDLFREFAYLNTPIFQDVPEEIDETWTHGVLVRGMAQPDPVQVARAYKAAGDALMEQALKSSEPHELGYPILFSYRHAIESYLKVVTEYELERGDNAAHSILDLLKNFEAKYGNALPDWAKNRLIDFHNADPRSTSFRYADTIVFSTEGNEKWINFYQLKTILNGLCNLFEQIITTRLNTRLP
ncbi:MerR family transcriptional regulator [Nostoc sp. C057]|nr:MerR family transcriptional regulator [Nostoc sp. C057]